MVANLAPVIFWDPREAQFWPPSGSSHGTRHNRAFFHNARADIPTVPNPKIDTLSEVDTPVDTQTGVHQGRYEAHRQGVLPPNSLSVKAQLVQDTAKVSISQQFINDTAYAISNASYAFPLPVGSTVVDFKCRIGGGRWLQGQVKPRQVAHKEFHSAIKSNKSAALLDQHTPEIFSTSLGAIPRDSRVQLDISFVTLLKYRFMNGLGVTTFTLPTYIAPRYGAPPQTLPQTSLCSVELEHLDIEINVLATNKISSIECATQNVDISLGTGSEQCQTWKEFIVPSHAKLQDERKARVKLFAGNTHLDQDFTIDILTIPEDSLESPFACVETHPSYPHQRALMLTIPANFMLRQESYGLPREFIFVADLSGSMSDKVDSLKSSMKFFLNGLPVDCCFNITCFGSTSKSLWPRTRKYSESTLQEAISYVSSTFNADMGGTELLPALKDVFGMTTQHCLSDIVVLTDGQIWELKETLDLVQNKKLESEGFMRLFALGVGDAVSHELVEGLAKAGGGYAEVIPAHQQQGWESKMVSVLQAALKGHIAPLQVELDGVEIGEHSLDHWLANQNQDESTAGETQRPRAPPANDIFWSPRNLTFLSPFLRNRLFVLVDSTTQIRLPLSRLTIKVTGAGAEPVSVAVLIKELAQPGSMIHKLGARTILGDLERGQSHLHISGASPTSTMVQQEGERLGCKWSLVSQWTSFVTTEGEIPDNDNQQDSLADQELGIEVPDTNESNLLRPRHLHFTSAYSDPQHIAMGYPTEDSDVFSEAQMPLLGFASMFDVLGYAPMPAPEFASSRSCGDTPGENKSGDAAFTNATQTDFDSLAASPGFMPHAWGQALEPSSLVGNSNAAYSNAPISPSLDHRYSNAASKNSRKPKGTRNKITLSKMRFSPIGYTRGSPTGSTAMIQSATDRVDSEEEKNKSNFIKRLVSLQRFDGSFSISPDETTVSPDIRPPDLSARDNVGALFGGDFMTRVALVQESAPFKKIVAEPEKVAVTAAIMAILDLHFQSCKSLWQRMYEKGDRYLSRCRDLEKQTVKNIVLTIFRDFKVPYVRISTQLPSATGTKDHGPSEPNSPPSNSELLYRDEITSHEQKPASQQQEDTAARRVSLDIAPIDDEL